MPKETSMVSFRRRKTWREIWARKQRFLRAERFRAAHALNVMIWAAGCDEYFAEMAIRGPWAGLAEDLADESLNRENTTRRDFQTFSR
jgi:hypothetical protein